jgi:CheY-like chemotaxis protein
MTACRHIRSKHGSAKIVVMSGDIDLEKAAAKAGAVAAIRKPFTGSELGKLIASFDEDAVQATVANSPEEMAHREDPSGPPTQGEIAHV